MKKAVKIYLHLLEMARSDPEKFEATLEEISLSPAGHKALVRDMFRVRSMLSNMQLFDALKLGQKTYRSLVSSGLHELRAQMASYLGSIYIYLSNYELAETYFTEAIELYEKSEKNLPRELYIAYLYNYTLVIARDGRFREATQTMEKLWREMEDSDASENYKKMFLLRISMFMVRVAVYSMDLKMLSVWKDTLDTLIRETSSLSVESPFEYRVTCGAHGINGLVERFAHGNLEESVKHGLKALSCASAHGIKPEFEYLRNAAESLVYLGREEELHEIFELAREEVKTVQQVHPDKKEINSVYAMEIMALEHRITGNSEKAYEILQEAASWYGKRGLLLECLYARVMMEYTGRILLSGKTNPQNVKYIQQWLPVYPFLEKDPIYGLFVREIGKRKQRFHVIGPRPKTKFWLLGGFRMESDGLFFAPKDWRRKKSLFALKYLILNRGRKVLMDELSFVLWPNETEEVVRPRLWVTVSYIRKMLGYAGKYLHTENGSYVLEETPNIWIDVVEFERLVKRAMALENTRAEQSLSLGQMALDLYKGELLPEDKFQVWLDEHRRYFHRLFVKVLLLTAELKHNVSPRDSLKLLEEFAERWPMEEEIVSELVSKLMLAGDETKAQTIYNNFRRMLWNKHRMKPSFKI